MNLRERLLQQAPVSPEYLAWKKKLRLGVYKFAVAFLCAEAGVFLFIWWLFRG